MNYGMGKCVMCTDGALSRGGPDLPLLASIPDAVVSVTVIQQFAVGGQQMPAPVQMHLCLNCRAGQISRVSKTGLVTA